MKPTKDDYPLLLFTLYCNYFLIILKKECTERARLSKGNMQIKGRNS